MGDNKMIVLFFQGMNMKGNLWNYIKSSKKNIRKIMIYINMIVYVFIRINV